MSSSDTLNDVSKTFNEKFNSIGYRAVLINLGLYAALSFGIIILFSLLRPKIRTVYEPKSKYAPEGKKPPAISRGFFAWLSPIFGAKEDDLVESLGLDAVAYLRFLRMLRYLFLGIAILVCAALLPCNIVYNLRNVDSNRRDYLGMLTIRNLSGEILFVHVGVSYVIHIMCYWFIWTNTRRMVDLRWKYFRSDEYQKSLHSRSIMLTQIQRKDQNDERVASLIANMGVPYPTNAVHIGRKVGELPDLLDTHSQKVKDFEQCLTTYIKKGANPDKRPTITSGGCLGVGGDKRDAVNEYKAVLARLEQQVWTARGQIDLRKPQSYGFASFSRVPYAHMVAQKLAGKSVRGARVQLAPSPKDIIWENLLKNDHARRSATIFGTLLLGFIMVIYTAPLAVVSAISNLASLTAYVPFLSDWSGSSPTTFAIVSGVLPPLLAVLLQLILPMIIRAICKWQGAITHTRLDRAVFARYFFFLVITQFIVIALLGMIFSMVADIVNESGSGSFVWGEVKQLPEKIQSTYVQQSSYFLTWFPLRGFSAVFEIAQLISLFLNMFRTKLFGRTRRQKEEWSAPPPMDYAVYGANTLLMVMVAMVYAPLAPVVAVAAAIAFFASSFVTKYMLLYVFTTEVESGGRMWRLYINRLLVSILFMQLFICLTIALQTQYIKAIAAAPPIISLAAFKWYTNHRFGQKFRWYLPDNEEIVTLPSFGAEDGVEVKSTDASKAAGKLAKRFGHPSLHQQLLRPYVYKSQEAALRDILGDVEVKRVNDQKGTEAIVAGGIKFTAFDDNAEDLTQEEYLKRQKEQDDWETGSIASTAISSAGGAVLQEKDYFNTRQRPDYLRHGPSGLGLPPVETPYEDDASGAVPNRARTDSIESRDNLLETAAMPSVGRAQSPATSFQTNTGYAVVNNPSMESLHQERLAGDDGILDSYYDDPTPRGTNFPDPYGARAPSRLHSRNGSSTSLGSLGSYQSQGAIAMGPPQGFQGSHQYPPVGGTPAPSYRTAPYGPGGTPPQQYQQQQQYQQPQQRQYNYGNPRMPPGAAPAGAGGSYPSSRAQSPYHHSPGSSQDYRYY